MKCEFGAYHCVSYDIPIHGVYYYDILNKKLVLNNVDITNFQSHRDYFYSIASMHILRIYTCKFPAYRHMEKEQQFVGLRQYRFLQRQ